MRLGRVGKARDCFVTPWTKCGRQLTITFFKEEGFFSWKKGRPGTNGSSHNIYDVSEPQKIRYLVRELETTINHGDAFDSAIDFVLSRVGPEIAREIQADMLVRAAQAAAAVA